MSAATILTIPGDGIGPEVVRQAVKLASALGEAADLELRFEEALAGGAAIDETGEPLPAETLKRALSADALLLGAVGGPKWDSTDPESPRPEQALLGLRKGLDLYANLRPVTVFEPLIAASTLKEAVVRGVDILVVRELTGGLYFGDRARTSSGAYDTCIYSRDEIERIATIAFESALLRRRKVTSVDKANILETSRLWRETVEKVATSYPQVELEHHLVDNCAMQLIRNPGQYDVILTENMFGDILSDEAAMITGSIGMLPSASLGPRIERSAASGFFGEARRALYEPVHGSAPDIAGRGKANPIATILSVALMFRYSFHRDDLARAIEEAVLAVLGEGHRTSDLAGDGLAPVGTEEMGRLIAERALANHRQAVRQ